MTLSTVDFILIPIHQISQFQEASADNQPSCFIRTWCRLRRRRQQQLDTRQFTSLIRKLWSTDTDAPDLRHIHTSYFHTDKACTNNFYVYISGTQRHRRHTDIDG